jgi:Chaperone of endosialidase
LRIGNSWNGAAYTYPMVITSGGNVGIGTTTPLQLLHVGSASASGIVAEFQNSSGACTLSPGSSVMTTTCSSDVRLKTNIRDTNDALPSLADMRVRDFTVKATGENRTGVIAQELLTTHPEMVHMTANGFYAVDAPNPWTLVKAVQELKAANDNQAAEIRELHKRLTALEAAKR